MANTADLYASSRVAPAQTSNPPPVSVDTSSLPADWQNPTQGIQPQIPIGGIYGMPSPTAPIGASERGQHRTWFDDLVDDQIDKFKTHPIVQGMKYAGAAGAMLAGAPEVLRGGAAALAAADTLSTAVGRALTLASLYGGNIADEMGEQGEEGIDDLVRVLRTHLGGHLSTRIEAPVTQTLETPIGVAEQGVAKRAATVLKPTVQAAPQWARTAAAAARQAAQNAEGNTKSKLIEIGEFLESWAKRFEHIRSPFVWKE